MNCGNTYCKRAQSPCMKGRGNPNADIVILGEAPGAEEDAAGMPFVGKAGRFLFSRVFRASGIREDDVWITNSVKCFPGRSKSGKITNPKADNVRKCRRLVSEEMRRLSPKVIIAMGNAALHSCLGLARMRDDEKKKDTALTGITKWRGKQIWHSEWGCWVVPTYHPSYLMRVYSFQKHDFNNTVDDFILAMTLVDRPKPEKVKAESLFVIKTPRKAAAYLEAVSSATEVAVDTETTTLEFRGMNRASLLGVSLATYNLVSLDGLEIQACYIPAETLFDPHVRSAFQKLLDSRVDKIWHNVGFDERALRMCGFTFQDINNMCTMIAAKLIDENFSVGLKELTWRYLSFGGYSTTLDNFMQEKRGRGFHDVPFNVLAQYAALDALATVCLWRRFKGWLKKLKMWPLYVCVVKARRIFTEFEMVGLGVDMERSKKIEERCVLVKEYLLKKIYSLVGGSLDIGSYQQVGKAIYSTLKAPQEVKTRTGQPATDADTLNSLLRKRIPPKARQFIQIYLDIKYIDKLMSTYIEKVRKVVWEDGRVHTRYNLTGTVTGRPSSSDPNISNIPKDGLIRSLYVPTKGNVFVECDMGAAELRVLAQYCQEPTMLEAFANGEDLHEQTARILLDKPKNYTPTKQERDRGKRLNFGTVYGIGPDKLASSFGVSVPEAKSFLELYFYKFAHIKRWLDENTEYGMCNQYTVSYFNRRRRVPEIRSDSFRDASRAIRQCNNAVIQSCASDLCFVGIIRAQYLIHKRKMKAKIVHSVYDSVLVDSPPEEVEEVKDVLKKAFETPVQGLPDFMMRVDFTVEDRWGKHNTSKLHEVLNLVPWSKRASS